MKRNIILTATIFTFFSLLIATLVYFEFPDLFSSDEDQSPSIPLNEVWYPVVRGEIRRTYESMGSIEGISSEYISVISLNKLNEKNFSMIKNRGDEILPGEPIYELKGAKKSLSFPAKIVNVERAGKSGSESVQITLLNYEKLYISCMIDESKISLINYNTLANVRIGKHSYNTSISYIDYAISDKKLAVRLLLPAPYLPGTEVSVSFLLSVEPSALFTAAEAFFMNGDEYYANVLHGEELKQKKVQIGQHFNIENDDGTISTYFEIIGGLEEGDILVVEQVNTDGERIRRFYGQ